MGLSLVMTLEGTFALKWLVARFAVVFLRGEDTISRVLLTRQALPSKEV